MRTLVMGGTRFLGVEVVNELLRAGHEVVAFHRGSRQPEWVASVEQVIGDRNVQQDRALLAELDIDVVVDLSAYTADQTRSMLETVPMRRIQEQAALRRNTSRHRLPRRRRHR